MLLRCTCSGSKGFFKIDFIFTIASQINEAASQRGKTPAHANATIVDTVQNFVLTGGGTATGFGKKISI